MAVTSCAQGQSFELQEAKLAGLHQAVPACAIRELRHAGSAWSRAHAAARRLEQEAKTKKLEQQIETIASGVHHIGRIVGALVSQHSY